MTAAVVALVATSAACATIERNLFGPRRDDPTPEQLLHQAWRGHTTLEIEKHAVFSTMDVRRQEVSDGSVILHYVRCALWRDPDRVRVYGNTATFKPGEEGQVCCDRQFVVRAERVEQYRQVPSAGGSCTTEQTLYPDGRRQAAD